MALDSLCIFFLAGVDEVLTTHAREGHRRNELLTRLAEQQRQIDALQKSNDQQETRHQKQLATQTQQQQLIDELLSNQAELQRQNRTLQEQNDQQQRQNRTLQEQNDQQQRQNRTLQEQNDQQQCQNRTLQERNDQQQRQIQELEDSVNCPICLSSRREVVFLCGHSACQDCSIRLNRCHICRNQITDRISFFWWVCIFIYIYMFTNWHAGYVHWSATTVTW